MSYRSPILIESQWNLNKRAIRERHKVNKILIESQWNLNNDKDLKDNYGD